MVKLSESQVKKAGTERLIIAQNQGKGIYLRLQSGSFLVKYGANVHKIELCPSGTSDAVFIYKADFIEWKSSTGKQSPEQKAFEQEVIRCGSRYHIFRDAGELEGILK